MIFTLAVIPQQFEFSTLQQYIVADGAVGRLLLAACLGGIVGLERELKRKSAGVRTNLLICVGAAFFTLLGEVLAGEGSPNKGQVASNIVQGIGFLGAGLILHNRSRVTGLASAASIWVVASIGMACGAGLYLAAGLGAALVICSLTIVGVIEQRVNLKSFLMTYEIRGTDQNRVLQSVLDAMDRVKLRLANLETSVIGDLQRVSFPLAATRGQHKRLCADLVGKPGIEKILTFRDPEDD
jgi:putative Mg2+ transporter-C (MgtC) family protein